MAALIYPLTVVTTSGYKATVTNPSTGKYHFAVTAPTGYADFDYNETETDTTSKTGHMDSVKHELLHAFWEKQRNV